MCMCVLPSCMCIMSMPGTCGGQKRTPDVLESGVTDGCKPACVGWELNPGPVQDQQVLLTTALSLTPPPSTFEPYGLPILDT